MRFGHILNSKRIKESLRLLGFEVKIPGFSLIETVLTLMVTGIVISLTLPVLTTAQRSSRHQITQTNQYQLLQVLAGYVVKNDRLPAPSRPDKKGESMDLETDGRVIGIIPYKELGISEAMARDGYGHWFTYAVVPELLLDNSDKEGFMRDLAFNRYFCHDVIPEKIIELKSISEDPLLKEQKKSTDFIAVVLISHGPKGSCAFHPTENKRLPVTNNHSLEAKNAKDDLKFVVRTKDDNNQAFDHEVFWATRNNLLAIYGKCPCQPLPYGFADNPFSRGNFPKKDPPQQPPKKEDLSQDVTSLWS